MVVIDPESKEEYLQRINSENNGRNNRMPDAYANRLHDLQRFADSKRVDFNVREFYHERYIRLDNGLPFEEKFELVYPEIIDALSKEGICKLLNYFLEN